MILPNNKIFSRLINLRSSPDRLERAQQTLAAAGLSVERFDAVDGRSADLTTHPDYDPDMAIARYGRHLSSGEVACYLSHKACLQAFLDSGAPYGLILEDDLSLPPDFAGFLDQCVTWLDTHHRGRWDMLNMCQRGDKVATSLTSFQTDEGEIHLLASFFFPLNSTGCLWSREGAERFLKDGSTIFAPVDQFVKMWCIESGRGLALDRPVVNTFETPSTIDYSVQDAYLAQRRTGLGPFVARRYKHQRTKLTAMRNRRRFRLPPPPRRPTRPDA